MIDPNTLTNRLIDGASEFRYTVSYASSTTVTIEGDWRNLIQVGTKIQFSQGGVGKFGYVTNVSFSSPNTTLTLVLRPGDVLTNNSIETVYMTGSGDMRAHEIQIAYNLSITGATVNPNYTTNTVTRFGVTGKQCDVVITLNNTSGGTAGSGTGALVFNLPISYKASLFVGSRSVVGHGWYVNGSNVESLVAITAAVSNQFFLRKPSGGAITGNDQNGTNRSINLNLRYPI